MILETTRLIMRHWRYEDAGSLFAYASSPLVGPAAGWPPHQSLEESQQIIQSVLSAPECYAILEKESYEVIGCIELMLFDQSRLCTNEEECELGFWLGRPFWSKGYMQEAASKMIEHAFMDLEMQGIWCGCYEDNFRSKRVQEKMGFTFHYTNENVQVPLLHEVRTAQIRYLTKTQWLLSRK